MNRRGYDATAALWVLTLGTPAPASAQSFEPRTGLVVSAGTQGTAWPVSQGGLDRRRRITRLPDRPVIQWRTELHRSIVGEPLATSYGGWFVLAGGEQLVELSPKGAVAHSTYLGAERADDMALLADDSVVVLAGRQVLGFHAGQVRFRVSLFAAARWPVPLPSGGFFVTEDFRYGTTLSLYSSQGTFQRRSHGFSPVSLPPVYAGPLGMLLVGPAGQLHAWSLGEFSRRLARADEGAGSEIPRVAAWSDTLGLMKLTSARVTVFRAGAWHELFAAPPGVSLRDAVLRADGGVSLLIQSSATPAATPTPSTRSTNSRPTYEFALLSLDSSGKEIAKTRLPTFLPQGARLLVDDAGTTLVAGRDLLLISKGGAVTSLGPVCTEGGSRSRYRYRPSRAVGLPEQEPAELTALAASKAGFLVGCDSGTVLFFADSRANTGSRRQ